MQGGWLLTSCEYNSKLVSGFDKEGEGRKKQELIAMHRHYNYYVNWSTVSLLHRRCKILQWQIYLMRPKWWRKMTLAIEVQLWYEKKTIIISLQLSIMDAKIKPLSKEVTVMTMEDMDSHSTAKQVMWSSAFVVGDSIWTNLIITWLIAVNAVQALIVLP